MLQFDDFFAWIEVDGDHLPEYRVEYSREKKQVKCWIPSQAGKAFSVHWRHRNRQFATSGRVHIDGSFAGSRLLEAPGRPTYSPSDVVSLNSARTSATTARSLLFSSVELTDDDEMQAAESVRDLGEIRLEIWQVSCLYVIRGPKPIHTFNPVDKVHERSKKAVLHSVQLGAEVPTKPTETVQTAKVCEQVTFIFYYRPLDILQAKGMAPTAIKRPASPSPPPTPLKSELSENDADEEIAALEEQLRQLKKRKKSKAVKAEFKQEGSHLNGEVIDLTED
ncbi:hypothetical protein ARMGADRAFT_1056489 [Armillaria gallica]|uniref:DUF7918 domain-containing protein n=1 Tax=Armillaria gallica TaxID=47427 RepID=A0A2H3E790_ARMGA|nr:hypothetical protein ARMGADRAFT_1056489 [Armillaria gallica]